VTGEFEVRPFGDPHPWVVTGTSVKLYPLEYHAQVPVELMREVRATVAPSDITAITVDTYWTAFDEIGNDPDKWAPTTRETADHSLPFLLAVTLLEGEVTPASFDAAHLEDPRIAELVRRVSVREDEEFTERWPRELPGRLTVTTRTGERLTLHRDHPLGHPRRPLPPAEVDAKFTRLTAPLLGEGAAAAALGRLRSVGEVADTAEIVDLFTAGSPR
jgi:2-methylcitrate dehydratase